MSIHWPWTEPIYSLCTQKRGYIKRSPLFVFSFLLCYREVLEKDAKDYADSIQAIFVETSAKNAININEIFTEISKDLFKQLVICGILRRVDYNLAQIDFIKHEILQGTKYV